MFSLMEAVLWKSLPVAGAASTAAGRLGVRPEGSVRARSGATESQTANGGFTSTSILLPRVRGDAARRRVAGRPPVRVQADWPADGRHRRPGGAGARRAGLRRLLSIDRRAPGWRAAPSCRQTIGATPTARSPSSARRSGPGASAATARSSARRFSLNQVPVTIVGVNPPAFTGLSSRPQAGRLPAAHHAAGRAAVAPRQDAVADRRSRLLVGALHGRGSHRASMSARLQRALDAAMGDQVRPLLDATPGPARPHAAV